MCEVTSASRATASASDTAAALSSGVPGAADVTSTYSVTSAALVVRYLRCQNSAMAFDLQHSLRRPGPTLILA